MRPLLVSADGQRGISSLSLGVSGRRGADQEEVTNLSLERNFSPSFSEWVRGSGEPTLPVNIVGVEPDFCR